MTSGTQVYNTGKKKRERINRILRMHADKSEPMDSVSAGDIAVFIGLKNYVELFQNETFRKVVVNTFTFTIFSLIFQFSIGFLFALFFKKDFKLSGPIRGLILIAYMMPMSVTG